MQPDEITALFEQQAPSYDQQWSRLAALNDALHLMTSAVFSGLPADARVLCVGSGTGAEILNLARRFPGWHFTAVEPSAAMLEVFRKKADEEGVLARCTLHAGYVESLPEDRVFHAATSFLVSQFILDRRKRSGFFTEIARRLQPGGRLVSSDLAADLDSVQGKCLLEVWFCMMRGNNLSPEAVEKMRETYQRDVAVVPATEVADILMEGGFDPPVRFFQTGLIHAWYADEAGDTRARPT